MANAGVAAEDAAQNVVAAGVQELMAEEELPEIAMPEALAEADDTMEAGTSAEDVEAAILAETARQMAKESVEKEVAENIVPARPGSYRSHRLSTVHITLQRSAQIPGD